jgi:hypothetical protein
MCLSNNWIINLRIPFPQLIYSQYSIRFFIYFSEENFWFFCQNFNISENNIVSVELAQVLQYSNSAPRNIHTLPHSQPRWTSADTGTTTKFWIDCGHLEYLHRRMVCDLALEIWDQVQRSVEFGERLMVSFQTPGTVW